MRAVWLTEFGGPEVLVAGDAPDPEPGPGQVLIDVEFANITFVETQFRANGFGPFRGRPPLVPGNGVGGVVAAVGPGVAADMVGRRVVTSTGGSGGYAERVAVDAAGVIDVPGGLALDDAVALLADGRTAIMLTRAVDLRHGDRVLVEAAAGGVGSLLVQLARGAGATVVAAVGGPRKAVVARGLGADVVADYREPDWADRVRASVAEVDVVFDGVGGAVGRTAFGLLGRGGRMASYGLASGEWANVSEADAGSRGVVLVQASAPPARLRAYAETALAEAAAGRLRPLIGQRFPLDRAWEAHAAIEARATIGKTLLAVR
ncbi:zinc-binding dehydrogenase [Marinitenerispora sediminis]|uniref:NADPH:quinone reductase n=1 Tax=Marinitenerispora sediminis TaxID=1931232 RepID=A0A368TA63_9ACTN|nr:zinc-binding dehydrogenase [Marinitenerispora sediminis]RCV52959.1 NADPH:quinone reductase [Marinitenerispora sediminis]RCV58438.1 NADPH:quinone reductase [Marinitenerispora sediminis]RCV61782.1 NADPH:quinone reductase [Marinitenerispora sediminis]